MAFIRQVNILIGMYLYFRIPLHVYYTLCLQMHPTPQGVTLDFEQYDKLKDVDKVLPTLLPELRKHVTLSVYTSKPRGSYIL